MVSPCNNCGHKNTCRYIPLMEQTTTEMEKIFSNVDIVAGDKQCSLTDLGVISYRLKCKYYTAPIVATR